jgi:hypothetical protein
MDGGSQDEPAFADVGPPRPGSVGRRGPAGQGQADREGRGEGSGGGGTKRCKLCLQPAKLPNPKCAVHPTRTGWRKAHDFHEFAELLDVDVDHIMAAKIDRPMAVVYTPEFVDPLKDSPVFMVKLDRDADGILRALGEPVELAGYWRKLEEHMDGVVGAD